MGQSSEAFVRELGATLAYLFAQLDQWDSQKAPLNCKLYREMAADARLLLNELMTAPLPSAQAVLGTLIFESQAALEMYEDSLLSIELASNSPRFTELNALLARFKEVN